VFRAVLEEADSSKDVDLGVEVRLLYRAPHVHLGGLVAERLGLEVSEDLGTPRADVSLVELRPFGDVLAPARREVVDDGDFVSALEHEPRHVRSDKPGSPGQKDPHLRSLRCVLGAKPVVAFEPLPETRTRSRFSRGPRGPGSVAPNPTRL
jgi:hypothetical protein